MSGIPTSISSFFGFWLNLPDCPDVSMKTDTDAYIQPCYQGITATWICQIVANLFP